MHWNHSHSPKIIFGHFGAENALWKKIKIFEIFQKCWFFENFKSFYSQNYYLYEKNSQDKKYFKLSKFCIEITLIPQKSFLAILKLKTHYENFKNFWKISKMLIFWKFQKLLQPKLLVVWKKFPGPKNF